MRRILPLLIVIVGPFLAGCAHNGTVFLADRTIDTPRVVALDAPRTPWTVEIERRLRAEGFEVLRWSSQQRVREYAGAGRVEEYREATTRYVLVVDGYAPLDWMHRCFAGGFRFDYLSAELVDVAENETLFSFSGHGYSEKCPPMSGRLFRGIVDAMSQTWK